MKTMDQLALQETVYELWTDKSSRLHDYLRLYDREFSKWRDEPIRIMEIGLNKGASIKLWLEYFTRATVFGVDINPFLNEVGILDQSRFKFVQGDAFDANFWNSFKQDHPERFDIIIDDGCHFSGPIIIAHASLWDHVKNGGYYVIEDLGEVRNSQSHTPGFPNQIDYVKALVGVVNSPSTDIDEMYCSKELCMLRKKE